jgi:hypothetical protein
MKHIKSIYEYRYQMEIPFEVGKHPIHDKPVHQHIIDVLEDLNTKTNPDSYVSSESIENLWDKYEDEGRRMYVDNTSDYPVMAVNGFMNKYPISENPDLYSDTAKEEYEDFESLMYSITDSPSTYLTSEGEKKMDEVLYDDYYYEALYELDVKYKLEEYQDEDGLIPIYRAINYFKSEFGDEFETAIRHGGVVLYWSWEESGAYPHGGGLGDTYILYGKVKPENVNWARTIYKSAWELREEKEIEINKKGEVLIYAIGEWENKMRVTNIKPIVVPA